MAFFDEIKVDRLALSQIKKAIEPRLQGLAAALAEGVEKDSLHSQVAVAMGVKEDHPSVQVARMNLIGGLRSTGYQVTGGRGGGKLYQIVGFSEEKTEKASIEDAAAEVRAPFEWLCQHELLAETPATIARLDSEYAQRPHESLMHSSNWMHLWAYRGAGRNKLWLVELDDSLNIVVQKFVNRPKLSIIWVGGPLEGSVRLAERLAPSSLGAMSITGMELNRVDELKALHPKGSVDNRSTAIYNLKDFVENPDKYLNKRSRSTLKARLKDTELVVNPGTGAQRAVIDVWRKGNQDRHRQLAINRDFMAVDSIAEGKITTGGRREDHWVAHHLVYRVPNRSDAVMLANEKSLNYADMPGGKYGMSDWNQMTMAKLLVDQGINYMQSGGLDGGGVGLPDKKKKYAESFVDEPSFILDLPRAQY